MAIQESNLGAPRQFYGSGQWNLRGLNHITVIFGRNGSGKSLILRQLRDQNAERRHYVSPERGGDFNFQPGYVSEETEPGTRANRRKGNTAATYREEGVARIQAYLAKRGNDRSERAPSSPEDIEKLMNVLLPAFSFRIVSASNPVQLTRISSAQVTTSANQMSSGEAALYALGMDLVSICSMWALDNIGGLLLVDEPDLHLHPDLQQHLAGFLVQLVDKFNVQIMIATHSTTLLAALGHYGGARTSVIYLDPTKNDQTATPFSEVEKQLATILGGHALMGPLFSVPLLLVEGDDDYKVWSHAPRYHVLKVSVIPCEGSTIAEYERKLEAIFKTIIETARPVAYSIKDLDDRTVQPTPDQSREFVRRLWLNCRETENLYLTEQVLSQIGTSPDDAKSKIRAAASGYGNKAGRLLGVADSSDWQHHDLKDLTEEISQVIDPKRVDWRIRTGSVIGQARPEGQLQEFLGVQVMEALWPATTEQSG